MGSGARDGFEAVPDQVGGVRPRRLRGCLRMQQRDDDRPHDAVRRDGCERPPFDAYPS